MWMIIHAFRRRLTAWETVPVISSTIYLPPFFLFPSGHHVRLSCNVPPGNRKGVCPWQGVCVPLYDDPGGGLLPMPLDFK